MGLQRRRDETTVMKGYDYRQCLWIKLYMNETTAKDGLAYSYEQIRLQLVMNEI